VREFFYACKGAHTLFTGQSVREREKERERERERGKERERGYVQNCYFYDFIFKRNEWCLGTF
jgi:hypothetical protein